MENDIFSIKINIGGTKLPLSIARKDEELYRKAEKLLVKHLDIYLQKYRGKSREEILTYVAYQFSVMLYKQELVEEFVPLAEKIQSLDKELEVLLSGE